MPSLQPTGRRARRFILAAILAMVFAAISHGVVAGIADGVDRSLLAHLALTADSASALLIAAMQGISWLGGGVVRWLLLLLFGAALWRGDDPHAALRLTVTAIAANLASTGLKILYARPRPDLVPHLDHVTSFSYPSGHATSITAIAVALILLVPPHWRRLTIGLGAAAILLTGLSRMMLGVHWPSDVLGGTLLGAAVALAIAGGQRPGRAPLSANSAISGP